jgi:hypothetical protein
MSTDGVDKISKPPHSATLPPLRRAEVQFAMVDTTAVAADHRYLGRVPGSLDPMNVCLFHGTDGLRKSVGRSLYWSYFP